VKPGAKRNKWIVPPAAHLPLIAAGDRDLLWRWVLGHSDNTASRSIERFTLSNAPRTDQRHRLVVLAFGHRDGVRQILLLPVTGARCRLPHPCAEDCAQLRRAAVRGVGDRVHHFRQGQHPARRNANWLKKGGGMLSGQEVPSHRSTPARRLFSGAECLLSRDRGRLGLCSTSRSPLAVHAWRHADHPHDPPGGGC
jgi:hypothetical protein